MTSGEPKNEDSSRGRGRPGGAPAAGGEAPPADKADLPTGSARPVPAPGSYAATLATAAESFLPLSGDWPADADALRVDGDCLAPNIASGDHVVAAPNETPQPGDLVVAWLKGAEMPVCKRLMGFADGAARLEDNPRACFKVPGGRIETMHKVIHVARGGGVTPVPAINRAADLPMVKPIGRGRGFDYWSIDAPAGYAEGCRYGHELGLAVGQYALGSSGAFVGTLLGPVAESQSSKAQIAPHRANGERGVVIGFWNTIGDLLTAGATASTIIALRDLYREREADYAAALERERKENAAERSERARRATLIGAAKRRAARKAA
ncbi:MAG: S24 family peptidase [Parvibaculum sp.]|nr:S24 family peptidase [Parvibaculum sp.]